MLTEQASQPRFAGEGWTIRVDALGRIQVSFFGYTKSHALVSCLDTLSTLVREREHVIVDIRRLEGHNIETRDLWKNWLTTHKKQLKAVTVVLQRAMVLHKMVTAALGLAVGLRLEVAEDIP